jgi:hypothetical protein
MIHAAYFGVYSLLLSDIDECQTSNGGCDVNAACTNEPPGNFTCKCKAGYGGDGFSCTGGQIVY